MLRHKQSILKFILFVTALQVLNSGLFYQDFDSEKVCRNDGNVINSVAEFFAETVMSMKNAFPENEKSENGSAHKHNLTFKFENLKAINCNDGHTFIEMSQSASFKTEEQQQLYHQYVKEINPPPPKA